jgi:hypothetical protein
MQWVEGDAAHSLDTLKIALNSTVECIRCWFAVFSPLFRPSMTLGSLFLSFLIKYGSIALSYLYRFILIVWNQLKILLENSDPWVLFGIVVALFLLMIMYLLQRHIVEV